MQKSDEFLMHWLLVVRQARILMDHTNLIEDEFTTSTTLQKWIGLSYELTDEEAIPVLDEAIADELNIGKGHLPDTSLEYFQLDKKHLLTQPLEAKKSWFRKVRSQRVTSDKTNIIEDQFPHSLLFKEWVGLA